MYAQNLARILNDEIVELQKLQELNFSFHTVDIFLRQGGKIKFWDCDKPLCSRLQVL